MSSDDFEAEIQRRLAEEEHKRRLRDLESQINELRRHIDRIETLERNVGKAEEELRKVENEIAKAGEELAKYASDSKAGIDKLADEGRRELSKLKDQIAHTRERVARNEGISEARAHPNITVHGGTAVGGDNNNAGSQTFGSGDIEK